MLNLFKYLIVVCVVLFSLSNCDYYKSRNSYNCAVAPSTPADLIIINNTSRKVKVGLLVKETTLKQIRSLRIKSNQEKEICIEYEGINGVYIRIEEEVIKVKLKPQKVNKFYIKSRTLE